MAEGREDDTMSTLTFTIPKIQFDGFEFPEGAGNHLWALEMAYRARRGDALAVELLNKFQMVVKDANWNNYWPMVKPDTPTVVE